MTAGDWKTRSREVVLSAPPYLVVEDHTVELPDGRVIPHWKWVITPDYVNVVAVTDEGMFVCFRQTKYAVEGTTLAPVAGYVATGEDPSTAARRELREETGYESENWTSLGSYAVDGNRGVGVGHLFLARAARRVAEVGPGSDLEDQELLLLTREQVEAALDAGEFKVLNWNAAMALALLRS